MRRTAPLARCSCGVTFPHLDKGRGHDGRPCYSAQRQGFQFLENTP